MSELPFQYRDQAVMTFRQLDQLNDVPKGTSFRAFKRVLPALEEGVDFFCLTESEHLRLSEVLRQCEALYSSSVNVVLVTRRGYERMQRGI